MAATRHSEPMLRWGLLSTAPINGHLIPALRAAGRAELLAVASRSQDTATAYAAEWHIPRAYGSYKDLLADPDVDAVYVSVPHSLHAEWTVRAAQAGKHVLCEKPLTLDVADCDRILLAARAAGVVAMEAIMYLYHPLMHQVRQMVREGIVGEVRLVRGSFCFFLSRPRSTRRQPELGGGALWDVGIYPVSFARWIAGEPVAVQGWQTRGPSGVDETFAGLLRFPGDVQGVFDCSFQSPYRTVVEVVGTTGTLIVQRPFNINEETRLLVHREQEEEELAFPMAEPYRCEVEALTAAVLDGAPLAVPLEWSRANVATLVALYESSKGE
jgi:xylose dehydrogenase (NAD/NADP)